MSFSADPKYLKWIYLKDNKNFILACILLLLIIPLCIAWIVDHRTVQEVNTWIKPIKFAASIGIYVLTIIGITHLLSIKDRTKRILLNIIFWAMLIEFLLIFMQAGRGVASHFNNQGALFDLMVFNLMGLCILINTIVLIVICILYFKRKYRNVSVTSSLWLAIQMGLIILLFSSAIGAKMIELNHHAVNTNQMNTIVPFFGWKLGAGDLRISHFIGIHALQILPIFTITMEKYFNIHQRVLKRLILSASMIYLLTTISVFILSLYQDLSYV